MHVALNSRLVFYLLLQMENSVDFFGFQTLKNYLGLKNIRLCASWSTESRQFCCKNARVNKPQESQNGGQKLAPKFIKTEAAETKTRIVRACWNPILHSRGLRRRCPHLNRHLSGAVGLTSRLALQTRTTTRPKRPNAPSPGWTWCCPARRWPEIDISSMQNIEIIPTLTL